MFVAKRAQERCHSSAPVMSFQCVTLESQKRMMSSQCLTLGSRELNFK
ncbi:MAG: hypothetical protein ACEY3F_02745 [Wolbachia sp.]